MFLSKNLPLNHLVQTLLRICCNHKSIEVSKSSGARQTELMAEKQLNSEKSWLSQSSGGRPEAKGASAARLTRRQGVIACGGGGGAKDARGRRSGGRLRSAAPREARLHHGRGRRGWGRLGGGGDGWGRHEGGVLQMMQPAPTSICLPPRPGVRGGWMYGGRVHVPAHESHTAGSTTPRRATPSTGTRAASSQGPPQAHLIFLLYKFCRKKLDIAGWMNEKYSFVLTLDMTSF